MAFFLRGRSLLIFCFVATAKQTPFVFADGSYEVWACDQSNSVEGQDALGVRGSYLWIWDSSVVDDVLQHGMDAQVARAADQDVGQKTLSCSPDATTGPCDLFTIFPESLVDSESGESLGDAAGFGRWHGITKDPQNKYVTANIFAPGGGYLGVVDTETKEAVGLFRVTEMTYVTDPAENVTATTRNVHMSFWNADGSTILIHNLAGKALERINVERDAETGKITSLVFDKGATLGFGKGMEVSREASFYIGEGAFGSSLLGAVIGSYEDADLGDLTPTGACKENGCSDGTADTAGRPNNVPICPIMSSNGLAFNTMGGGGLLVVDTNMVPMSIVGAYGNDVVYGAGVCGTQVSDKVYLTSGASASGAGATQSMFTLFAFDPAAYDISVDYEENMPAPVILFDDETGTATGGKTVGDGSNDSGQLPATTTRRDAHDLAGTLDGKYIHVIDRIQNIVEVFDSTTNEHVGAYDLTTESGVPDDGTVGPCAAASVMDGGDDFPINDPAPDFIDPTPDGKYMMLSFRGPAPVSAGHAAQGSCPGVGIVELKDGGASGALVAVLRSSNTVADTLEAVAPPGGATYSGAERSDIHDVVVIFKESDSTPQTPDPGTNDDGGDDAASGTRTKDSFIISFFLAVAYILIW